MNPLTPRYTDDGHDDDVIEVVGVRVGVYVCTCSVARLASVHDHEVDQVTDELVDPVVVVDKYTEPDLQIRWVSRLAVGFLFIFFFFSLFCLDMYVKVP